jgi:hypothetical protein
LVCFYIAKKPKLRAAVKQEIFNIIAWRTLFLINW